MTDYSQTTLTFVVLGTKILLGYKKRGFGEGKWVGIGGKVLPNEEILASAKREIFEEVGLTVNNLEPRGYINFSWIGEMAKYSTKMHIFFTTDFLGEITESDECKPQWFELDNLPLAQMWDDNKYWLSDFLKGKQIHKSIIMSNEDKVEAIKDL